MSDAAIAQARFGKSAWLSNPTLLLCLVGIVLPNIFSLGALVSDIGSPPRTGAIVAYAALVLIARNVSPAVFVPLYLAVVVYDLIATIALLFGLAPTEIALALNLGAELDFFRSPLYLSLIFGLGSLVALNVFLLVRKRETLRQGNIFVMAGLALAFAAADLLANTSPHYQFGTLYGANKKVESASIDSGFRQAVLAGEPRRALMIVVEALGALDDPGKQALVFAPFRDSGLLGRYEITFGTTTYYGSTTAAELRELCDTRKSYKDMRADREIVCLPQIMAERGYRTAALHNYTGVFFERPSWYPRVGFHESTFGEDLRSRDLRWCGGAFRGPCDVELVPLVARHLRDAVEPTFFYWVTLSTHVPVAPRDARPALGCAADGGPIGHAEVCYMAEMWIELFEALARMTADIPPTEILIVGDHAPPLWSKSGRAQFTPGKVPWVRLTPRAQPAS